MAKKSGYKAKNKAKYNAKNKPKNNAKNRAKPQIRNKRPNKKKPSEKSTGVTVKVDGGRGGSAVLPIILIIVAVLAVVFLVFCIINGYHNHRDKNNDHYCDVKDCAICLPVDEDGDGLCDICGGCANGHVDTDSNCECDRCKKDNHIDADKNGWCDKCDEWMPLTGIGKGFKQTIDTECTITDVRTKTATKGNYISTRR